MLPIPVLWMTITGLLPARYAPAHIPTPFSSRVSGIVKISLAISGSSAFILSHGRVAAKSIPFFLSISTTCFSGFKSIPFCEAILQVGHSHFLHMPQVLSYACRNPFQAASRRRLLYSGLCGHLRSLSKYQLHLLMMQLQPRQGGRYR